MATRPMLVLCDYSHNAIPGVVGAGGHRRPLALTPPASFSVATPTSSGAAIGAWYGRTHPPDSYDPQWAAGRTAWGKGPDRSAALEWFTYIATEAAITAGWFVVVEADDADSSLVGVTGWSWRIGIDAISAGEAVAEFFWGPQELTTTVPLWDAFADAVAYIDLHYGDP